MYYWKESYEDIYKSAPRAKRGRGGASRAVEVKGHVCVCQEKGVKEQLDRLAEIVSRIAPETVVHSVKRHFNQDLCCCQKNYCKHNDLMPMTPEELNEDLWDLYTYFLNEFNIHRQVNKSEEHIEPPVTEKPKPDPIIRDAVIDPIAECSARKDDSSDSELSFKLFDDSEDENSKDPDPKCATDKDESSDTELSFNLFDDDVSKGNSHQWDPCFKVTIMDTLKKCMKYRDIHRFFLLQHVKLITCFISFAQNASTEQDMDEEIVLPPSD